MIDEKIKMLFSSYWDDELTDDEEDRLFSILHAVKEARVIFKDYYKMQLEHLRSALKIGFPKMLDTKVAQTTGSVPFPGVSATRPIWLKKWSIPVPVAIAAVFLVAFLTISVYEGVFQNRVDSLRQEARQTGSSNALFTSDELDAVYLTKIKELKKVKITEMDRLPLSVNN